MRWEDKRSVRMLTSVHELEFCATGQKIYLTNEDIIKTKVCSGVQSKYGWYR